jgi:hypothetical protein
VGEALLLAGRGGHVPAERHVQVRGGRADHVPHGQAGRVPHGSACHVPCGQTGLFLVPGGGSSA